MGQIIDQVLIDEKTVRKKVKDIAAAVSRDYKGRDLVLVGTLKGAVVFMSDLMRALKIPAMIDFVQVSSYGNSTGSKGKVKFIKDLDTSIKDKDVLIIEDIVDTGHTLDYLLQALKLRKPATLNICALLDKPARRTVEVPVKYRGFEVPDKFIVGYGLDYAETLFSTNPLRVLFAEKVERVRPPRSAPRPLDFWRT